MTEYIVQVDEVVLEREAAKNGVDAASYAQQLLDGACAEFKRRHQAEDVAEAGAAFQAMTPEEQATVAPQIRTLLKLA